jgi:hypothetical protein
MHKLSNQMGLTFWVRGTFLSVILNAMVSFR